MQSVLLFSLSVSHADYQNQTKGYILMKFIMDMPWCLRTMVTSQQMLEVIAIKGRIKSPAYVP